MEYLIVTNAFPLLHENCSATKITYLENLYVYGIAETIQCPTCKIYMR